MLVYANECKYFPMGVFLVNGLECWLVNFNIIEVS